MANFDHLQPSDLLVHDGDVRAGLWFEGLRSAQDDGPETVAELLDVLPTAKVTYAQSEAGITADLERASRVLASMNSGTFGSASTKDDDLHPFTVRLARGVISYPSVHGQARFISDAGHSITLSASVPPPAGPIWAAISFQSASISLVCQMPDEGDRTIPTYTGAPGRDFARFILLMFVIDGLDFAFDPRIREEDYDLFRKFFQEAYLVLGGSLGGTINGSPFTEWFPDFLAQHRGPRPDRNTAAYNILRRAQELLGPELPEPRLVKTAAKAEEYAADVMRALGFPDAAVTGPGSDGGIDVDSDEAVAQVKMEGLPTGRPALQALYGVASVEGKRAIFFSLAGYTPQAIEWAGRSGMACFEFAFDGSIEARTTAAEHLLHPALQP